MLRDRLRVAFLVYMGDWSTIGLHFETSRRIVILSIVRPFLFCFLKGSGSQVMTAPRKAFILLALSIGMVGIANSSPLKATLRVPWQRVLEYGVVVAYIDITAVESVELTPWLDFRSGNVFIQLIRPDGSTFIAGGAEPICRETIRRIALARGDQITIPLSLLKYNQEYLFKESGEYRLTAILNCPLKHGEVRERVSTHSNERIVIVEKGCDEVLEYRKSHLSITVLKAFSLGKAYEKIYEKLDQYGCYQFEQMKLLSMQCGGRMMTGAVLRRKDYDNQVDIWYTRGKEISELIGTGGELWAWLEEVRSGHARITWSQQPRYVLMEGGYVF